MHLLLRVELHELVRHCFEVYGTIIKASMICGE